MLWKSWLVVVVIVTGSCAQTPEVIVVERPSSTAAVKAISYYAGTISVTSPEGKALGPPTATVLERIVDPAKGTIVEKTIDTRTPRTTTLKRRGETSVFDVSDDAGSFTGTVTFTGEAWRYTGWRSAITMTDKSGTLTGHATITDTTITTEKLLSSADGAPRARIVDTLTVVDRARYDETRQTLLEP